MLPTPESLHFTATELSISLRIPVLEQSQEASSVTGLFIQIKSIESHSLWNFTISVPPGVIYPQVYLSQIDRKFPGLIKTLLGKHVQVSVSYQISEQVGPPVMMLVQLPAGEQSLTFLHILFIQQ